MVEQTNHWFQVVYVLEGRRHLLAAADVDENIEAMIKLCGAVPVPTLHWRASQACHVLSILQALGNTRF